MNIQRCSLFAKKHQWERKGAVMETGIPSQKNPLGYEDAEHIEPIGLYQCARCKVIALGEHYLPPQGRALP